MKNIRTFALRKSVFILLVCLGTSVSGAQLLLDQPTMEASTPRAGEVLKYSAKLRGISAGTQIMQVSGKKLRDGHEVYHVESVSKAKRIFAIFYPFNNQSESFIQSKNLYPLHYKKRIGTEDTVGAPL